MSAQVFAARRLVTVLSVGLFGFVGSASAYELGPQQLVRAGEWNITVPGYSVPSFTHWNNDGLCDLIVGEGGGGYTGKVRVYLNVGTPTAPQFSTFLYAQSLGADLTIPASGCMAGYPRVGHWDGDGKKDLLVGQGDGKIKVFLNTGTDDAPTFDGGAFLQVGPAGQKVDINVGGRATANAVDWNNDGRKDLLVGALDGKLRVYINEGTDTAPDFLTTLILQAGSSDLLVPSQRSSPALVDWDQDGRKDLLTGNTNGQLLFYPNVGTDEWPAFSTYTAVTSDGVPIDLPGTNRSRPAVCDWTGDGLPDVLIGYGDGLVRLYEAVPEPGSVVLLSVGALLIARVRR